MPGKSTASKAPGKRSSPSGLDPALVKALAHPMRVRVLSRLNEVVASPKELATEFGVSLPMLSYHFRVLADIGAIELVSETSVRGAIEHHYRATTRAFFSDEDWREMPDNVFDEAGWKELRLLLSETLARARAIQAESAERLQAGKSGGDEVTARLTVLLYEGTGSRSR
jgi:DNA-binding transcriptional ArsR family regulator